MPAPSRRARGRYAHVLLLAAIAQVGLLHGAQSVAADDYGYNGNDGIRFADSADHWYCFTSSVPAGTERNRITGSMQFLDDVTDMYDVAASGCGASTDVAWFHQTPIPEVPGARGMALCVTHSAWGVCDQFWAKVDGVQIFSEANGAANFDVNMAKTIRHELGHTTGLRHGSSTSLRAMVSGPVPTDLYYTTYSAHHIGHINAYF